MAFRSDKNKMKGKMKGFVIQLIIVFMIVSETSCRAKRSVVSHEASHSATAEQAEVHSTDSLWASLLEQLTVKIEFYEPTPSDTGSISTIHKVNNVNESETTAEGYPTLSLGAVKSIEITQTKEIQTAQVTAVDSVSAVETEQTTTADIDKHTEAGHDYGVFFILAMAALLLFLIWIRKYKLL